MVEVWEVVGVGVEEGPVGRGRSPRRGPWEGSCCSAVVLNAASPVVTV